MQISDNKQKSLKEKMYEALINIHKYFFDYDKKQLKDELACYMETYPVCGSKHIKNIGQKIGLK